MMDITLEEWGVKLVEIQAELKTRVPMVKTEIGMSEHDLRLKTECCRANLRLSISRAGESFVSEVHVGSGRALTGTISEVECWLAEYRAVLDAMHFCIACTQNLEIWPEGSCPCSYCGASGETRSGKCDRCKDGFR